MHRFFLKPDSFISSRVKISGDTAEQIRRVLRLKPGDSLVLLDGLGYEYRGILVSVGKEEAWAEVKERRAVTTEAHVRVTLYLSLLNKSDKYEWALQKCTELGVARFVPLVTERTVAEKFSTSRRERWERILSEAAEQSGRGYIPVLDEVMPIEKALAAEANLVTPKDAKRHVALLPEVGERTSLREILGGSDPKPETVSLFIGPEGGFTNREVENAEERGVKLVTLGPRILRAETAAVAGAALVMFQLEEMEYDSERHTRD